MPDETDLPIPAFLEKPTEGWLAPKAKRRGDQIFTIPAVSLAECNRRVQAERQRAIAIVTEHLLETLYPPDEDGFLLACNAIVAALEARE